ARRLVWSALHPTGSEGVMPSGTSMVAHVAGAPVDLNAGRGTPLFLFPDGTLSLTTALAPGGIAAKDALVAAARWVSARRTTAFNRLFLPSPFHPERPVSDVGLMPAQGRR